MGGKRHSEEMKAAIVTYWLNNHQNPDWNWQSVAKTFSVPKTTVSSFKIRFPGYAFQPIKVHFLSPSPFMQF